MPTFSKTYVREFVTPDGKKHYCHNSEIIVNVKNSQKILTLAQVDKQLVLMLSNMSVEIYNMFGRQVKEKLVSHNFNLQTNPAAKFVVPHVYEAVEIIVQLGNVDYYGFKATSKKGKHSDIIVVTLFVNKCTYASILNTMAKALNWIKASINNCVSIYKTLEPKNVTMFEERLSEGVSKNGLLNFEIEKKVKVAETRPNITNYIFKVGRGIRTESQLTTAQKCAIDIIMPTVLEEVAFLRKLGVTNKLDFVFQLRPTLHRGGLAVLHNNQECEIVINLFDKVELSCGNNHRNLALVRSKEMMTQIIRHECGHIYHFVIVDRNNRTTSRQRENFADSYAQDRGSKWEDAIWAKTEGGIAYRNFKYTSTGINKISIKN